MADKPINPETASPDRTIRAGENYFERVEGNAYLGAWPSGDPDALREAYLNRLLKKSCEWL